MDCKTARELTEDYVVSRLKGNEKADFNVHQTECPKCREYLRNWINLDRQLDIALYDLRPSKELSTRILRSRTSSSG